MSLSAAERYCSVRVGASAAMPGAAARSMRAIGSRNRMDEDLISHDSRDRLPEVGSQNTRRAGFPLVDLHRGNQGYSHDATRVACEIFWSGEIGEVREVHAWTGRPSWPQEMTKIPAPTPVPDTLNWDLWLGGAEFRPYTQGDQEYVDFVTARNGRGGRGGAPGGAMGGPGGAPGGPGGAMEIGRASCRER